ncbi:MAG: HAMP domain-containing sensor histidine kinase [Bacteroidales bacterium]|nr:HAMP domain-containing sensor histidine kinase [Bacteroidales bacterium]
MNVSFENFLKGEKQGENIADVNKLVKRSNVLAVILLTAFIISLAGMLFNSDNQIYNRVLAFLGVIELLALAALSLSAAGYLFLSGLMLNALVCILFFGLSIFFFGKEAGFHNYFLLLSLVPLITFKRGHRIHAMMIFCINVLLYLFVSLFPGSVIAYTPFPQEYLTIVSSSYVLLVYLVMLALVIINIRVTSKKENSLRREAMEAHLVNERLKDINDSKDRFFSIISHDLRAPLGTVSAFLDYFTDESENFTKEEIKEAVASMNKYTHEVYALLENLLTWSRIQSGTIKVNLKHESITERIRMNVELYAANATKKEITLICSVNEDIVLDFDPDMINTIFRNLINNAIKFTPRGGEIAINAVRRSDNVEITVQDSGKGMSDTTLKDLFLIDKKQNSCLGTEGEKGSGLGLILCKHFVECHNGTLSISSSRGKGCRVMFSIPFQQS